MDVILSHGDKVSIMCTVIDATEDAYSMDIGGKVVVIPVDAVHKSAMSLEYDSELDCGG
jgi:hypothetical protein